jgi:hypothetical protein
MRRSGGAKWVFRSSEAAGTLRYIAVHFYLYQQTQIIEFFKEITACRYSRYILSGISACREKKRNTAKTSKKRSQQIKLN